MKSKDLRDWIDSLTDDIEFCYRGKWGSVCPFTRAEISLFYDDKEVTVTSVDAAMKEPFVDGFSLEEISEHITL